MEIVFFSFIFALWCVFHSALATDKSKRAAALYGLKSSRYRLTYNLVSTVTLIPVVVVYLEIRGDFRFWLPFPFLVLQIAVLLFALGLAVAAFRDYDAMAFLGLREEEGRLSIGGVLEWCRHPLYLSSILLFWARHLEPVDWAVNIIATLYFLVGIRIEERRLLSAHGENYRAYRERTSMLIPRRPRRPSK